MQSGFGRRHPHSGVILNLSKDLVGIHLVRCCRSIRLHLVRWSPGDWPRSRQWLPRIGCSGAGQGPSGPEGGERDPSTSSGWHLEVVARGVVRRPGKQVERTRRPGASRHANV